MDLITMFKHRFIREGKPTALVKRLRGSPRGEVILKMILEYYLTHTDHTQRCDEPLDTNINIEDYRWKDKK